MTDIVRVIRILEYVGDRAWVEQTLSTSAVPMNGTHLVGRSKDGPNGFVPRISSRTLGDFPEIVGVEID